MAEDIKTIYERYGITENNKPTILKKRLVDCDLGDATARLMGDIRTAVQYTSQNYDFIHHNEGITLEHIIQLDKDGPRFGKKIRSLLDKVVKDNRLCYLKDHETPAFQAMLDFYGFGSEQSQDADQETRIDKKLGELFKKNVGFITTPLKHLKGLCLESESIMTKLQGKEGFDFVADIALCSEEQLKAAGLEKSDIDQIDVELKQYGFQLDMPKLAREMVEKEDQQKAEVEENQRLETRLTGLKQKYGL